MDTVRDLLHDVKNALQGVMLVDEMLALSPSGGQSLHEGLQQAREAWRRLETEQKRFIKACAGRKHEG